MYWYISYPGRWETEPDMETSAWRPVIQHCGAESGGLNHGQGHSLCSTRLLTATKENPDTPTPTKAKAEQNSTSLDTTELTEPQLEPQAHKQCSQGSLYGTVRFTTLYKNKMNLVTK